MNWVVILAGGQGQRLWPLSRASQPKIFLKLFGSSSTLQQTVSRARKLVGAGRVITVTDQSHAAVCRKQLQPIACRRQMLAEPRGRNTAAAIGLAAVAAVKRDPQAVLWVFPADHRIENFKKFRRNMNQAARLARSGKMVVFGIRPTYPATGFGYIVPGSRLTDGGRRVRRFVEKPNLMNARRLLRNRGVRWNSGIFCFQASLYLRECQKHLPILARGLYRLEEGWSSPGRRKREIARLYAGVPSISVDHGILEKSASVAMVPADFAWSDWGTWLSLAKWNRGRNLMVGRVQALNTRHSVIYNDQRNGHLVAAYGLDQMALIHTPDVTLCIPLEESDRVRQLVKSLQRRDGGWWV